MEYRSCFQKNRVDMLPCMAAFAVVVEAGSFVDASVRLGLTASAVSKQVSKLENALSMKLLERTTRQLRVNAEGSQIYYHCKELLESSANIFLLGEKFLKVPQGLIRVAVPRSLFNVCNQLVPAFLEKYPNVSVQILQSEGELDFVEESIDIGILVTNSPPLNLVAKELFTVDFLLCASASYLERHGYPVHPSSLGDHSCVLYSDVSASRHWMFTSGCECSNVDVSGRYCAESPEAVLEATLSGLGISCLPLKLAMKEIDSKRLVQVLPDWKYVGPLQGMSWITFQPGRHVSQKVKVTVDYFVENLRKTENIQI